MHIVHFFYWAYGQPMKNPFFPEPAFKNKIAVPNIKMSSVHVALSQRKTNTFKIDAATDYWLLPTIVAAQVGTTTQIGGSSGGMFVIAGTGAFNLGTRTGQITVTGSTVTDLGKTIVLQQAGSDAYMKLQEVKYHTGLTTFVTGYVVVENNMNLNGYTVTVSRV